MCSVQLETVEAGVLRVECGVDPRLLQVVEVRGGEFSSQAGAVQCQAGGADGFDLGVQARVLAAFDSEVRGTRVCGPAAGSGMYVPSVMIKPTPPAARRR